ncbi:hypothetical protein [Paraglaciecola sp. L3A3]
MRPYSTSTSSKFNNPSFGTVVAAKKILFLNNSASHPGGAISCRLIA